MGLFLFFSLIIFSLSELSLVDITAGAKDGAADKRNMSKNLQAPSAVRAILAIQFHFMLRSVRYARNLLKG